MDADTAFRLIGLLLALGLAIAGLRAARRRRREDKEREDATRRERRDQEPGGPWGGG